MPSILAISMGCPAGIGPEVTLAAVALQADVHHAVVYGDLGLLQARAVAVGLDPQRLVRLVHPALTHDLPAGAIGVVQIGPALSESARLPGVPTREGGVAQLSYINAAADAVARGAADALVTAPVSKSAIASSGAPDSAHFLGHTEHLGLRFGGVETVMAFVAERLIVSLATTHLPIAKVATTLTPRHVSQAAYWTARLVDALEPISTSTPTPVSTAQGDADGARSGPLAVAILSLNPHAGESGLLGDEEGRILEVGMREARARLDAEGRSRPLAGPLPAESALRRTVHERAYAACVAMYHDQATIPSKLVAFGDAVNVTLGLPIVRTSVDHGTAYDLAGTGRADARGMSSALEAALRLAKSDLRRPLAS